MSIHPMASPTFCLVSIEVSSLTVTSDCSCLVTSTTVTTTATAAAATTTTTQRFMKVIYLHLFTDCFSSIVGMNTVFVSMTEEKSS